MLKKLLKNKRIFSDQLGLNENFQGAGDILVMETKRRRNELVVESLERIYNLIKYLFQLQKEDPERFERILLEKEYFDLYEKNKENAELALAFFPEKYLVGFYTPINQIFRVHEAALSVGNSEVSRHAVLYFIRILSDLTKTKKNGLFVEQLLRQIAKASREAIKSNDVSMYGATFRWYTDVVFDITEEDEEPFQLEYLETFDNYFFSSIQYVVNEDKLSLFRDLVRLLVEGIHVPIFSSPEVWEYAHKFLNADLNLYRRLDAEHGIEKTVSDLSNNQKYISSEEDLKKWMKRFKGIVEVLEPNFPAVQEELSDLKRKINQEARLTFKFNNALEHVFALGAFCVFKDKPEYIKYLWEFKQPPDSDASWSGHNIFPETLDEVVRFYFQKPWYRRRKDFFEDHHGNELYEKQYFILLLGRALNAVKKNEGSGEYDQINSFQLPDLPAYTMSDISHTVNNLLEVAEGLKEKKEFLYKLGFAEESLEEIFTIKLEVFLKILKKKAEDGIEIQHANKSISEGKVEEFEKDVLKEYKNASSLRGVLFYHGLLEDKSDTADQSQVRIGINQVDDKAIFFQDWHISYHGWGENYGRGMAHRETAYLLEKIEAVSESSDLISLDTEILEQANPESIFILAKNESLMHFTENHEKFQQRWLTNRKPIEVSNFQGWYSVGNLDIPVFSVFDESGSNKILLLNTNTFGKVVQLSPLDPQRPLEKRIETFSFEINAFSDNADLMDEIISQNPEWLRGEGSVENQKELLKKRVWIRIFQRIKFEPAQSFKGKVYEYRGEE